MATPGEGQSRDVVVELARAHPAWGRRKIWAMARHSSHQVAMSTVLWILDDEGLLLKADYQRERRQLAQARKAAFAASPTGPNQVWQLDFSEYETPTGGIWRVAGVADYWSKYEFGWHWSPTANQHDAIAAVEMALTEAQRILGEVPLVEHLTDPDTGDGPDHFGHRQRWSVPVVQVRRSHRWPAGAAARPDPGEVTGSERCPRAGVRVVEVRAALPPAHR